MTGMEDRQTIATDIAQACAKLNKDEALNSMPSIRNSEVGGVKKIPTISEPLLAVSASNLKSALIDPDIFPWPMPVCDSYSSRR